ncbi:hypothetical protein NZK32_15945 [Cyanobium sp. FGCU-52]|nr:hypothetical protein [Cyanobium sp. FGCU52]
MIFKRKFFLDLGGGDEKQPPATVAPVKAPAEAQPAAKGKAAPAAAAADKPAATAQPAAAPVAEAEAPASGALTTAEAIAAELAAAQANRPAPSLATFAPDCLTPGGALGRQRRRGGANLAGFKEMAKGMMGS